MQPVLPGRRSVPENYLTVFQLRRWTVAPEAAHATVTEPAKPTLAPARPNEPEHISAPSSPNWQRYLTSSLVVLLAAAIVFTVTRNWNSWEGSRIDQVTDDAYVRGDLTPLSTKVAGVV